MSTAPVSSLSILQELQSFYQNRQTDLKQLGTALQNGNLATAQQAYNTLQALGQSGPFGNSELFSNPGRAQAFAALGQSLQSGDLAGAQSAFAALTSKVNSSAVAPDSSPATIVNLSNSPTATSTATAASTSSSIYQQLQAFRQQRRSDIAQLGQDLQSGDLTAAQSDFNALSSLGESGPNKSGAPFGPGNREQDFQAIGQALQSGDLAGAQSAFASLSSTFGKQSQQAQTAISAYNSGIAEIVINFNPPTSTGTSTGATANGTSAGSVPGNTSGATTLVGPPVPQAANTTELVGPPIEGQPPIATPVESPATQTPPQSTPEIVVNFGGTSGASPAAGTQPEVVINLGQTSGSTTGNISEIDINFGAANAGSTVAATPEVQINLPSASSTGGAGEQITINLGNNTTGAEISIGAPQSQETTPGEQVTINLGNNNSSTEVSIGAPQSQGPTPSEHLTLNLAKNTSYELILNLLNPANHQSLNTSGNAVSVQA